MSVGDQPDQLRRLRAALPNGWFPGPNSDGTTNAPVLDGLLNGVAWVWTFLFTLLTYVTSQGRVATATDESLGLGALDFFGDTLRRRAGELDAAYRVRIQQELFREKVTRRGLMIRLTQLTGRAPLIFEPRNAMDTGGYGTPTETVSNGAFYGGPGGYGSLTLPFQVFVTAYRPNGSGDILTGAVTDAEIYAAIADCIPAGTVGWTSIVS